MGHRWDIQVHDILLPIGNENLKPGQELRCAESENEERAQGWVLGESGTCGREKCK